MNKFLTRVGTAAVLTAAVAIPSAAQFNSKTVTRVSETPNPAVLKATGVSEEMRREENIRRRMIPTRPQQSQAPGLTQAFKGNVFHPVLSSEKIGSIDDLPIMYGCDTFTSLGNPIGHYALPTKAPWIPECLIGYGNATHGGINIDGVYYCTFWWGFLGTTPVIQIEAYDVENRKFLRSFDTEDLRFVGLGGYAQDPTTGNVYAIYPDKSGYYNLLSKLNFTPTGISAETALSYVDNEWNGQWTTMAFDSNGQLYGIQNFGHESDHGFVSESAALYKIDITTGWPVKIKDLDVFSYYKSGSCIDPRTNRMFWNVQTLEGFSYMYEVDLQTGETTQLYQFPYCEEFVDLYVAEYAPDKAPASVSDLAVSFEGGSLSGTCSLTAPATLYDGTAGTGDLTIHVLANEQELATRTATWGEAMTIDLTVPEAGGYYFKVYATNSEGNSVPRRIRDYWVGQDTPVAPEATLQILDGKLDVTWTPADSTAHGGYVDFDNVTYTLERNVGETTAVAATGLTGTHFTDVGFEAPLDGPQNITYTIYAVNGENRSEGVKTNPVVFGSFLPPYEADFKNKGIAGWTVINNNDDNNFWRFNGNYCIVTYNESLAMDDYLVTPPIKIEAGKKYKMKFQTSGFAYDKTERLEVLFGSAPTVAGLTSKIVEPLELVGLNFVDVEVTLAAPVTGDYYVGFHGISEANQFYLCIQDVSIEEGVPSEAPGEVENLTLTPDPNGALKATITFNAPTKTMNGAALNSITSLDVLRGNDVIKTFENPQPGELLSYVDNLTASGTVSYTVVGYNEDGEGLRSNASVFVGYAKPATTTDMTITRTENEGELTVSWQPVTTDINGLTLPADEVSYVVSKMNGQKFEDLAVGLKDTSFTFQAVEPGTQDFVQMAIFAVSSIGMGGGLASDMEPVGKPYAGLHETVENAQLHYIWGMRSYDGGTVELSGTANGIQSQDGDGYMFILKGQTLDSGADLFSGLVTLEDMVNPTLSFYTFDIASLIGADASPDTNEISVAVKPVGANEWTDVYSGTVNQICANATDGWGRIEVPLAGYANQTIQFQITAKVKSYVTIPIDNIKVSSYLDKDLRADNISARDKVKVGTEYKVSVKVANDGKLDAQNYNVELYADGVLAGNSQGSVIAAGQEATHNFNLTMSPIATEPVKLTAKVVYAADENDGNNSTEEISVEPVLSTLPGAAELKAESNQEGVGLTWTAPTVSDSEASDVLDDFEDAEPFVNEYGDWTFYDLDQTPVGGFKETPIPGIKAGTTTGSFWIWDHKTAGTTNPTFAAHNGDKYLFSLYRYDDGTVNDWAVSPELSGQEQTISFYAKSYAAQYPEKIQVLYNTTLSTEPDSFTGVALAPTVLSNEWTLIEAKLPAGAIHFAINSIATGGFMLMIDDVVYIPSNAEGLTIEGYDIYRDGAKITENPLAECSWVDPNVTSGQTYSYITVARYVGHGPGAPSNRETIVYSPSGVGSNLDGNLYISTKDGCVIVRNASGLQVSVTSADGKVIYSGTGDDKTTVRTGAGVFLVKAGKTVRKVNVK